MPEQSPLSYQTTMPEYPDVSYEAYKNNYLKLSNHPEYNRAGVASYAWINGYANYENWRENIMTGYNTRLSAYNTWLQSGAGKRASALSGQYNPSYFDNSSPSASPISYGDAPEGAGFDEMAQGISGIFNFAKGLQDFMALSQQIKGMKLENAHKVLENNKQGLENQYLSKILQNKVAYGSHQASYMAYQSAFRKNEVEQELARRWGVPKIDPETGLLEGWRLNYAGSDFNLMNGDNGFSYQKNVGDLGLVQASVRLKNAQTKLANADEKVKTFYGTEIQKLERDLLSSRIALTDSQKELTDSKKVGQDTINTFLPDLKDIELRGKKFGLTHEQIKTVIEVINEAMNVYSNFVSF